jgi:hypothetical protein
MKQYTRMSVGKIHLKKKMDFIRDLNTFIRMNKNLFD